MNSGRTVGVRRSTLAGLLAVPVALALPLLLLRQGRLDWAVGLLAIGLMLLLALAVVEWRHGHRVWTVVLVAATLVIAGAVGSYGWSLNRQFEQIAKAPSNGALEVGPRPPKPKRPTAAVNILLMGSDERSLDRSAPKVAEMLAAGEWKPGAVRSDSLMVLHVPADRKHAYVISIPRDTYTTIRDPRGRARGKDRVNAAFSLYGPYGTWRTIEQLTGLRLDHMAIIDFAGFRELTTAIGGVRVYVPESFTDVYQDVTWERGWVHLEGDLALKYVRTRHGLENGDFDRVARQQNFLRATLMKMLSRDTMSSPSRISDMVGAVAHYLTVDETWQTRDLRNLVLSLRGIQTNQVEFVTLPLDHYENLPGLGWVNIIDPGDNRALWKAVGRGRLGRYIAEHPEIRLKDDKSVK